MFAVFRVKKSLVILAVLVIFQLALTGALCINMFQSKNTSIIDFSVVIDAGHGGIDGGVVSTNGTKESTLNLGYSKALGKLFEDRGFAVVYTRQTNAGLYGLPTKGFKQRDMQKRKEVIIKSNANLVVSIHMNKYSDSSRSGPQVFYQTDRIEGQALANSIQGALNKFTGNRHQALDGDFYVCRCSNLPSVIVECGFLSNPTEESKLLDENYRNQLVEQIFVGVMMYLYST